MEVSARAHNILDYISSQNSIHTVIIMKSENTNEKIYYLERDMHTNYILFGILTTIN